MILKFSLLLISINSIGVCKRSGVGRPPERVDYVACQVQMYERLDKIQEIEDPNAVVVAYFNRTGFPCKTYCMFKSANSNVAKITTIIDSPYYVTCGRDRYCSKGGKCKKIGTPLNLDETQTGGQEPSTTTASSSNRIATIGASGSSGFPGVASTGPGVVPGRSSGIIPGGSVGNATVASAGAVPGANVGNVPSGNASTVPGANVGNVPSGNASTFPGANVGNSPSGSVTVPGVSTPNGAANNKPIVGTPPKVGGPKLEEEE